MATPIKIFKRTKIHLLSGEFTLCGINAIAEGIKHTYNWKFDATCNAICKNCYDLGLAKI